MNWTVEFHPAFEREFDDYPEAVQDVMLARAGLLEINGPQLGRPYADTLKGSRHPNMKELRFDAADGAWPLPLTRSARRYSLLLETRRGGTKPVFTGG